jgi:hypothetical protein
MTRGPTKAVLTWLSRGTAAVRVEKGRPAQAGLRRARSKRSAPGTAESGQREIAGVGQLALEKGGLIRRSGGGYQLGRRTVELGGAFLTGVRPDPEFYRVCGDSEVLRHRLVQIAISTVPVCSTLPSMKGGSDSRFPPMSVTVIPHP